MRAATVTALVNVDQDADAIAAMLAKAVDDDDSAVRSSAIAGLASLGTKAVASLDVIRTALEDPEAEVRLAFAVLLSGYERASPPGNRFDCPCSFGLGYRPTDTGFCFPQKFLPERPAHDETPTR